uniref:Uncharacterized protein n=1 Tax=Arundo donax TaxID=35708 RepID=A0A0A9C3I4_ARUDO
MSVNDLINVSHGACLDRCLSFCLIIVLAGNVGHKLSRWTMFYC